MEEINVDINETKIFNLYPETAQLEIVSIHAPT